jgi:hypothetical protein
MGNRRPRSGSVLRDKDIGEPGICGVVFGFCGLVLGAGAGAGYLRGLPRPRTVEGSEFVVTCEGTTGGRAGALEGSVIQLFCFPPRLPSA